ncbi:MAG TPA: hypothetical protein VN980_01175 [Alphaproteobacteria bacterium]|nr:hypothetical protein [Alphaproteobacteria bacterium]
MRDTRILGTAFAAALASLLGLGPASAGDLSRPRESFQAGEESGGTLPVWLVRYKLRQLGYQDITRVSAQGDGFAVLAQDRWGRRVKLFVDAVTGEVVPRGGYGLAHLTREDVAQRLSALGYECLAPVDYREEHYQVLARTAEGKRLGLAIDPLSGAVWHERT